jgi:hypothetical protein
MTTNVTEAAMGNGSFVASRGNERMLLLFARYSGRENIQIRI